MLTSPFGFREKMALFWHGHFACRPQFPLLAQDYLNRIREHALSDFPTLLTSVSKSPAMILFLNNQQNRKGKPNENFAREVMELFTIGKGNYSETDVKEAARAFTGWGINRQTQAFEFHTKWHDRGSKTILGQTGNWNGDDVLRILLEQKSTAEFLVRKMYRFFVNESVDENAIQKLAATFRNSKYNIRSVLTEMVG